MRTITIDGHTFCPELLTESGWIIDIGCRGFNLPKWCAENKPRIIHEDFNYNTYCVDIENFDKPEGNIVTVFKHAALVSKSWKDIHPKVKAYYFDNGSGNFIKGINEPPYNGPDRPCETKEVDTMTLEDIHNEIGTNIDLLKIDAEGIEYFVLGDLKVFPRMISVETHQHCHPHLHNEFWEGIFQRLCESYHCNLYVRDWPQYKFMDCLFIRKDLL